VEELAFRPASPSLMINQGISPRVPTGTALLEPLLIPD